MGFDRSVCLLLVVSLVYDNKSWSFRLRLTTLYLLVERHKRYNKSLFHPKPLPETLPIECDRPEISRLWCP